MKMLRFEFETVAVDIGDDKEILWKLITNKDFDWVTPLIVRDSTNPMNDIILNLERCTAIKRYEKEHI